MFDHGNYDFDNQFRTTRRKMRPYANLFGDRWVKLDWASDRKQHRSPAVRRQTMRTCNKHVRQKFNEELRKLVYR
jgi:hypothetical protein